MTIADLRELLWILAIAFGWLSLIPIAIAWHGRKKFRALLKAPLSDEVEHMTHVWERRVARGTAAGLSLAVLSLLCFGLWIFSGMMV